MTKLFPGPTVQKGLQVTGLGKEFSGEPVLEGVSFTLEPGEILGLIGPNGAGKTTLMECLAGLLPFERGELRWRGEALTTAGRRAALWYQPDDILPYAERPAGAGLEFFRRALGREERFFRKLCERLGLPNKVLGKPVKTLSKGFRRRVLLAIALLSPRPLLLLDEPFDGFDLRQSLGIMELLRDFRGGRSMLLSIHQLSEAEKICDRFLLLDQGRVLGLGRREQLARAAGLEPQAGLEEIFLALT